MTLVLRGLGNPFVSAQPVIGTPVEVASMEALVAKTAPMRASTSVRQSPMIASVQRAPITTMGPRVDGSVDGGGSVEYMLPSGFNDSGPRPSSQSPSSTADYAQDPVVTDLVAPDQVQPAYAGGGAGIVPGGTSNWLLAGGIALGLLAVVGVAVAVSR